MSKRTSDRPRGQLERALALHQAGDLRRAEEGYLRILARAPGARRVRHYLGTLCLQTGRGTEAVEHLERAVSAGDTGAETLDHLGIALRLVGDLEASAAAHRRALAVSPTYSAASSNLALTLLNLGDPVGAETASRAALRTSPDFPEALNNLAIACREQGRLDEARAHLRRALALAPDLVEAVVALAEIDDAGARQADLERLEHLLAAGHLSAGQRRGVHFVLVQIYDALGDTRQAFGHAAAGQRLRQATFGPFDLDELRQRFVRLKRLGPDFFAAHQGCGHPSAQPLFIVGLPRSGTTLLERLLAGHPGVAAGGEQRTLHEMATEVLGTPSPLATRRFEPHWIHAQGQRYLAAMPADGLRVIDKLPRNLEHLWLATLLFANAHVIACRRDVRDTALSCFFRDFGFGHTYTSDLELLGLVIAETETLLEHWRRVLPISIHELHYESLVAHPEAQRDHLLMNCGLDPRLAGSETAGAPLYQRTRDPRDRMRDAVDSRSVGRWRRYQEHLGPLLDALGCSEE